MMSADDGESWTRAGVRQGMHSDCIVRMLRADARSPEVVYAGTDFGLYRSDDGGATWRLLENPMKGSVVWSMGIDPVDPSVMFAGTGTPSTPGIFRSTDGGKSWGKLRVDIADEVPERGRAATDRHRGRPDQRPERVGRARGRRRALQHRRRRDVEQG
jgi:photosystem II stability/assembly factor-like uncharacterized protein